MDVLEGKPAAVGTGTRVGARWAYLISLWLLIAAILTQVFFIGLALFYDDQFFGVHAEFGYTGVHLAALITLVLGFFTKMGRDLVVVNIVNFLFIFFMPQLIMLGGLAGGLHPVTALLVFGATLWLESHARELVAAARGQLPHHEMHPAE